MRRNELSYECMRMLAIGAVLATAACGKRDRENAGDTGVPAAATTDTGAMGTGAMGDTSASPGAMGPMSDPNILSVVGLSNSAEIASSKIAQTKATNANVKAFANDMVKDHTQMQGQADKIATQANLKPQTPPQADAMQRMTDSASQGLNSAAKGAAFDRQYMDLQVQAHQQTLDNLQRFQNEAQNAQVKTLIQQAIPKVQQHLQRARDIQGKLAASA